MINRVRDALPPAGSGSYADAESLRRWAFLKRTPAERLAWLIEALELAYRSEALKADNAGTTISPSGDRK